jgi:RNase P/RNase MRP subunit POP5
MSEKPVSPADAHSAVHNTLLHFLGEHGYGVAGIQFVKQEQHGGVLRVHSASVDAVKSGLLMMDRIRGVRATAGSVRVSGMLTTAHRALSS